MQNESFKIHCIYDKITDPSARQINEAAYEILEKYFQCFNSLPYIGQKLILSNPKMGVKISDISFTTDEILVFFKKI